VLNSLRELKKANVNVSPLGLVYKLIFVFRAYVSALFGIRATLPVRYLGLSSKDLVQQFSISMAFISAAAEGGSWKRVVYSLIKECSGIV